MTGFDIAVLLLVGGGAIIGFGRGFVHEILTLAAWACALVAIYLWHTPATLILEQFVGSESGAAVLAFLLLLLAPYLVVKFLASWVGKQSRNSVLGPVDRVLGLGFGAIKGIVIVVVAFSIMVLGYDTVWGAGGRPNWLVNAQSYRFVNASSEALVKLIAERRREAAAASEIVS